MRMILPLLTMALLLGLVDRAAAQDNPREIIDKAIKANGGEERIAKFKAGRTKAKGKLELMGGLDFTEENTIQIPGQFKSVVQLTVNNQAVTVTTVYNAGKGWLSINGQTKELDGKLLESLKEATYLAQVSRLTVLREKEYELAVLGEMKVEGKNTVGIRVSSKGQRDVSLYFDKKTWLVVKVERQTLDAMTGQEVKEERIITEFQQVDGVPVAKKVLVHRDGKKFLEAEVIEIKQLEKVDENEFAKP